MKIDDRLSQLLGAWTVDPPPAPNFQRRVWARIERKQVQAIGTDSILRGWFVLKLPQPAYAAALIALFALSGLGAASVVATHVERKERTILRERYLTSIDPIAMAGEQLRRP